MNERLFTHLLVSTDGSDAAVEAGRVAFRIAKACNARVTLVYVLDLEAVKHSARISNESRSEIEAHMMWEGHRYLDHLEDIAQRFGVNVSRETREGNPHKEIVALCDQIGADLIVIGHAGRRGMERKVVGSVAEMVTRFAHCPVLVVKD
jgi:nucleotide-binding universal stress UspA family protein